MIKALRTLAALLYMAGDALDGMADRWPEARERIEDKLIDLSLDLEDLARMAGRWAARTATGAARTGGAVARGLARQSIRAGAWLALAGILGAQAAYKKVRGLLPILAGMAWRMARRAAQRAAWIAQGMAASMRAAWSWRADLIAAAA